MRRLLLASAALIGLWAPSAHAQCPAAIPNPANQNAVFCFTENKPVGIRCATAIDPTSCDNLNAMAWSSGFLTPDGLSYLQQIGFCAIPAPFPLPPGILDFCPRGCFAADTQILTGGKSATGTNDYVAASSVAPNSSVMTMADDASVGDVSLARHAVKRIVLGPEDLDLFVFALSNGRALRVTQHHPMVLDDGSIIEARKVSPGMSFVGVDGEVVAVNAITRETPTADVFNFVTGSDTLLGHIIVAEGVLVGDLKIQNDLESEQAAIELRR
jgi:hypothetical protein